MDGAHRVVAVDLIEKTLAGVFHHRLTA